ncbi:hypothetical protein ACH9EU_08655 [Kocuria sp. M1R5S2]|uniref:hypothetical protein n=1 Tax=Kocuria rhizosphaerae TaxID=3376285 RepID=UPI0037B75D07
MAIDPAYESSTINWNLINRLAQRTAEISQVPKQGSITKKEARKGTRSREEQYGFLNLRTKRWMENYTYWQEVEILGPHWKLRSTYHNINTDVRGEISEYHEENLWALSQDGHLYKLWKWEEYSTRTGQDEGLDVRTMTDEDAMALDREIKSSGNGTPKRGVSTWGNKLVGEILYTAKGGGLMQALHNLEKNLTQHQV